MDKNDENILRLQFYEINNFKLQFLDKNNFTAVKFSIQFFNITAGLMKSLTK